MWLLTLRSGLGWNSKQDAERVRLGRMARHDLPQAIDEILRLSEENKLDCLGFSMGGMLLYAALGQSVPQSKINKAVIIGSPILIAPATPLMRWASLLPRFAFPHFRLRWLSVAVAFVVGVWRSPLHKVVCNPDNIEPYVMQRALGNLVADIPAQLNSEFLDIALSDSRELIVDGQNALGNLRGLEVPVLFIAGSADRVAPARSIRPAFEAWGQDTDCKKQWLLLGGRNADYGHGDLAIGKDAPQDIYEPIARFLNPEQRSRRDSNS